MSVGRSLRDAVAGTPLAERLELGAGPFLERWGEASVPLAPGLATGLARLLASQPEVAGFVARRTPLAERLLALTPGPEALEARGRALDAERPPAGDLEAGLDALRLLRREETAVAACLDLSGRVAFEAVSEFLSRLAEAIVRRALALAEARLPDGGARLAIVAMGKLAGREFSYHSDLDLIFLHAAGVEGLDVASRLAQRTVHYLTTMTGAGVAYAVDMRLRPSGHQGMLVTSLEGFERYQLEKAETWEHMALLRSRVVAGHVASAQPRLDAVRRGVLARGVEPWAYVADLRRRVETERAGREAGRAAFKAGPGGLMDVEFLAAAGLLERTPREAPGPDVPSLLRAAAPGPGAERLLDAYAFLRRLEARARWVAGRPVEHLDTGPASLAVVAELLEPGLGPEALLERLAGVRRGVRDAFERVLAARTIRAL